ncbi:hypothetical protein [Veronia pacifica]|uniref:hypothetical protein n=1 Tax=Veronia pacifica TaxID=1080227 RepID=UPI001112E32F
MSNNSILIICPSFNGYQNEIKHGVEQKGYESDLITYNEEIAFGINKLKYLLILLVRCIFCIFCMDYKKSESYAKIENYIYLRGKENLNNYLQSEIDKLIKNGKIYKSVLVVKGFGLNYSTIKKINLASQNNSILYQWDPLLRYPDVLKTYDHYQKVFTFQSTDVFKYPESIYFPTFYRKDKSLEKCTLEYDLCFVGVFAIGRYFRLNKIKKKCKALNLRVYFKLYSRNTFLRLFVPSDYLIDKKLGAVELREIYSRSKCVVDLCHSGQDGITQRVFQALSLSRYVFSDTPDIEKLKKLHPSLKTLVFDFNTIENLGNATLENTCFLEAKNSIESYEVSNWLSTVLDIK